MDSRGVVGLEPFGIRLAAAPTAASNIGSVMFYEYSAHSVPSHQRARYWQGTVSSVLFPVEASFRDAEAFDGTLRCWDLGSVSLIQFATDAARYVRRAHHVRGDGGDHALVSFSARSDVGFRQDGVDLLCRSRQFFLEKTQRTSDFNQFDANEIWTLRLPMASLARYMRSLDPFYGSLFDGDSGAGGLLFDLVRQIPHRYSSTSAFAAEGLGRTLTELFVLAVESDERAVVSAKSCVQNAHRARIERFVRRNLADPRLSPETIASACNISVRYLHALFRGSGQTVARWVRTMRLEAARADLSDRRYRDRLADIAYRWGFGDQAQFSRQFKAEFGVAPRDMRAAALRRSAEVR